MAITNYYVRPVNGADVAGQGTSHATAYKTLQFAFTDIIATHGQGADGDQVNLCSEGPNVNAASLSLDGFVLSGVAPVILRGYTSIAGDGGVGTINGGGFTLWAANYSYVKMIDLDCHTLGNGIGVQLNVNAAAIRCTIRQGASAPLNTYAFYGGSGSFLYNCYIPAYGTGVNSDVHGAKVYYSYIVSHNIAIQFSTDVIGNIIYCPGNTSGIYSVLSTYTVRNNSIYAASGNTGNGIFDVANRYDAQITNNILVNFSGVGGSGISLLSDAEIVGSNAFYNCTANYESVAEIHYDLRANDVALAADPFENAAAGNFMLTATAQALLRSVGWPSTYLGAAATDAQLTIGAVQYGEGGGEGGGRRARLQKHGV